MRNLLIIASVVFVQLAFAQTHTGIVKGRVIDARTYKPLPFATVYINQTTLGTVTNDQGDFLLQSIPVGRYDLVVSYVGYQTYQSRVLVNDTIPLATSIKMVASATNLDEILIRGKKDDKWAALYEKFQRYFFGVSPYTSQCKIINPWVLDLSEDKSGILTAKASLPIEIENLGLGYTITCQLKEFVAGAKVYTINGTYRFVEAQTMDTTLSALWNGRRHDIYLGSTRHLFKTLIENRAQESGFHLYIDKSNNPEVIRNMNFILNLNAALENLDVSSIVSRSSTEGHYFINLPARTEVHDLNHIAQPKIYRNVPNPISWLEVKGGPIEVNAEGVVMNPARLTIAGAMGDAHVAELLPLDYRAEQTTHNNTAITKKSYSRLTALLEKPYMMTDRSYYYPTDAIFFKTYFNYISPVYRDSLSHVMTADLIDSSGKIVYSKTFPVVGGKAVGDFILSDKIKPGDYTLRGYTRWMMNFDKQLIFTKGIKVLAPDQLARVEDIKPKEKHLHILTEKDEFETREKITLALEATDFYDNVIAADLAVSVSDLEQSATPSNETTILTSYPITTAMLPDTSLKTPNYLIQYGIDFKGQMVAGRKNVPTSGVLTVYQDDVDDVFAIPTDNTGKFHQQLQLVDSVDLLIASKTLKGKRARIIVEEVKNPVPSIEIAEPLKLDIYKPSDPAKYHVTDLFSTARMLEAVTIEAKKIENKSAGQKHILSDSHIDGDNLRSTNATDLLSALRSRVQGLRVLYTHDPGTQEVTRFLCFSGVIGYQGAEECLVELDGVLLNNATFGQSVADMLSTMSVQEIESVDVLRFGSASSYGARAANGVIIIKTLMGEKTPGPRKIDRSKLQVVSLAGYSRAEEFEAPDYSDHASGDDHVDLRTTIYWNPFVMTDGKTPMMVSFYAADLPTRYRIVVEGVTAEGEAVRGEKIIVVRSKK